MSWIHEIYLDDASNWACFLLTCDSFRHTQGCMYSILDLNVRGFTAFVRACFSLQQVAALSIIKSQKYKSPCFCPSADTHACRRTKISWKRLAVLSRALHSTKRIQVATKVVGWHADLLGRRVILSRVSLIAIHHFFWLKI